MYRISRYSYTSPPGTPDRALYPDPGAFKGFDLYDYIRVYTCTCVGFGSKHNRRFNYICRSAVPPHLAAASPPIVFEQPGVLSGDRNASDVVSQNRRCFAARDDISYGYENGFYEWSCSKYETLYIVRFETVDIG